MNECTAYLKASFSIFEFFISKCENRDQNALVVKHFTNFKHLPVTWPGLLLASILGLLALVFF